MPRGRGRDAEEAPSRRRDVMRLPRLESNGNGSEPLRPCGSRHDFRGRKRELTAEMIQVVEMMVVAEEHDVDRSHIFGKKRGPLRLAKRVHRRWIFGAGGIERRIGQEPHTVELE
jgi:hypothetical protein